MESSIFNERELNESNKKSYNYLIKMVRMGMIFILIYSSFYIFDYLYIYGKQQEWNKLNMEFGINCIVFIVGFVAYFNCYKIPLKAISIASLVFFLSLAFQSIVYPKNIFNGLFLKLLGFLLIYKSIKYAKEAQKELKFQQ